ncbi:hypothetical protein SCACP_02160 [Sporomusa carbonis]|uniref:pilus assembly protein TadG-related protein n=1 Tax=Sporomusa carbonis TaxID=3076075 RepID=UPI003A60B0CF
MLAVIRLVINKLTEERGSIATLSIFALTALMGFSALVIDVGVLYLNRVELVNLSDAAVLAGVRDLPGDIIAAQASAEAYARDNGKPNDRIKIDIIDNRYIIIDAVRSVDLFFARVFGYNTVDVRAQAAAAIKPVSGIAKIVPWGIEWKSFQYGVSYRLKEGGGSGYSGNYGALALGGTGAKVYEKNIMDGYNGIIRTGDWITTEPGNMSGKTQNGVAYRIAQDPNATFSTVKEGSPRIVVVPVVESLEVHGRSDVKVVGFAGFFLEGCGGSGNKNYVEGRFMQMVVPNAEVSESASSYGLYSSSLIPLSEVE